MQHFFKGSKLTKITSVCLALITGISFTGCVKWDSLTSPREGIIYMSQATPEKSVLTIYKVDTSKTVTFGASLSGFQTASSDINVTFEIDTDLISKYNADHSYLDYDFVPLPPDAYTVSGLTSTIKKGQSDTDPLSFTIDTKKLNGSLDYCLPVKIKSVSEGTIDSSMQITYFSIDTLYVRTRDVTSMGQLFVSNENDDGPDATEGSSKLVDNDITTKFLSFNFNPDFWMMLAMSSPVKVDEYTLTSGNDSPDRDPMNWELQGSDDAGHWVTLDVRNGYTFSDRQQTVSFPLNHPDGNTYLFYRLYVTSTEGGDSGLFQMSEWRLLQYY
ncbi:hypothetical protein A9P82_10205 [Arachidicoccus ginsenosidimutans]|uniref:BT_3987 domain-containing protein n=1 Tax=Arachidicoccus sp. BS20 TaxID=1850526 RepID=UPI0007F0BC91|nr:DUF1735 domain-containing protein [Arachidicoccus sp. BS20]ANI89626.1 hypothetical protein A9P82_10205 [Arachidicoccus sp. BS20]